MQLRISLSGLIIWSVATLPLTQDSLAVTISADYIDDPQCNIVGAGDLTEEFGTLPAFAMDLDEAIGSTANKAAKKVQCIGFLGAKKDDFVVTLLNSVDPQRTLFDVFLVSDTDVTFSNYDGFINGEQAKFLTNEWKPGELLKFTIMDSFKPGPIGLDIAVPAFSSLGISASGDGSTYSILANEKDNPDIDFIDERFPEPIPEPTTLALMGLGLAGIGYYKRHRSKKTA